MPQIITHITSVLYHNFTTGVSVAPITRDNCQEQERKEEPNVGIYDAEGALDDMFGVRQNMIGGADGERKRKRPESMEGILSKEDDGEEGNRDQSGGESVGIGMWVLFAIWLAR